MANFFFYRYHFVQLDEPDLFSEAEEGVTDFDERHNSRFAEDVAMNAEGIGKLELFNFKVDRSTGEETSVQYENDILHCRRTNSLFSHIIFAEFRPSCRLFCCIVLRGVAPCSRHLLSR